MESAPKLRPHNKPKPGKKVTVHEPPATSWVPRVVALVVILLGVAGWFLSSKQKTLSDVVLAGWAAQTQKSGLDAADLARQLRILATGTGAQIAADGIAVEIPAVDSDAPQTIHARVAYRMPMLAWRLPREFSVDTQGKGLVPGRYVGDGVKGPDVDPSIRARLERNLNATRCPEGTEQKGAAPPKGFETWCERAGQPGKQVGPYQAWHPNGELKEDGTYSAGQRDGKWTRYNADGSRAAEAFYSKGQQHGRFRAWDKSGQVVEDTEYRAGVPLPRSR